MPSGATNSASVYVHPSLATCCDLVPRSNHTVTDTKCVNCNKLEPFQCQVHVDRKTEKKQDWSFTLYNFDGHGKIRREEVANLFQTLYDAVGSSLKLPLNGRKTLKLRLSIGQDNSQLEADAAAHRDKDSGAPLTKKKAKLKSIGVSGRDEEDAGLKEIGLDKLTTAAADQSTTKVNNNIVAADAEAVKESSRSKLHGGRLSSATSLGHRLVLSCQEQRRLTELIQENMLRNQQQQMTRKLPETSHHHHHQRHRHHHHHHHHHHREGKRHKHNSVRKQGIENQDPCHNISNNNNNDDDDDDDDDDADDKREEEGELVEERRRRRRKGSNYLDLAGLDPGTTSIVEQKHHQQRTRLHATITLPCAANTTPVNACRDSVVAPLMPACTYDAVIKFGPGCGAPTLHLVPRPDACTESAPHHARPRPHPPPPPPSLPLSLALPDQCCRGSAAGKKAQHNYDGGGDGGCGGGGGGGGDHLKDPEEEAKRRKKKKRKEAKRVLNEKQATMTSGCYDNNNNNSNTSNGCCCSTWPDEHVDPVVAVSGGGLCGGGHIRCKVCSRKCHKNATKYNNTSRCNGRCAASNRQRIEAADATVHLYNNGNTNHHSNTVANGKRDAQVPEHHKHNNNNNNNNNHNNNNNNHNNNNNNHNNNHNNNNNNHNNEDNNNSNSTSNHHKRHHHHHNHHHHHHSNISANAHSHHHHHHHHHSNIINNISTTTNTANATTTSSGGVCSDRWVTMQNEINRCKVLSDGGAKMCTECLCSRCLRHAGRVRSGGEKVPANLPSHSADATQRKPGAAATSLLQHGQRPSPMGSVLPLAAAAVTTSSSSAAAATTTTAAVAVAMPISSSLSSSSQTFTANAATAAAATTTTTSALATVACTAAPTTAVDAHLRHQHHHHHHRRHHHQRHSHRHCHQAGCSEGHLPRGSGTDACTECAPTAVQQHVTNHEQVLAPLHPTVQRELLQPLHTSSEQQLMLVQHHEHHHIHEYHHHHHYQHYNQP